MAERKNVLLRLDPAVHDALARWASDEMRSTNAQIEFLLRRALKDAGRMPGHARKMRKPASRRPTRLLSRATTPDSHPPASARVSVGSRG